MVIRKIKPSDVDKFWQMQHELDNETKFMLYEPNERVKHLEILNSLFKKAEEGSNLFLVAEDSNNVVGFILASRGALNRIKHTAYIVVGIRKAFQGKGIGTEFFKRLDLWAKENGIKRLELTVVSTNEVALHLYEKSGFVKEGTKKDAMLIDGEYVDEFYMAKLLA